MSERKTKNLTVRVPLSWKKKCQERGIKISLVCRSALFQALQQSDEVIKSGSKLHSKQQAASLFNSFSYVRNSVNFKQHESELMELSFKLPMFRAIVAPLCSPKELIILGEFLDQGEYAEEILQEVFRM